MGQKVVVFNSALVEGPIIGAKSPLLFLFLEFH
jgi:hypothetical protein